MKNDFLLFVEKVLKKVVGKFFCSRKVLYFCRMKGFMAHQTVVGHSEGTLRGAQFGCVHRRKFRSKSAVCQLQKKCVK